MKRHMRIGLLWVLLVSGLFCWAPPSSSAPPKFGIGIEPVGFGINPDQYTFGIQGILGRFKKLQFGPSVDFGFGDGQELTTVNLDLLLDLVSPPKTDAVFYVGVGQGINVIKKKGEKRDTEIGLNIVGGIKLPFGSKNYYNVDARYGIGDVPDFKLLIGVMFGFGETG